MSRMRILLIDDEPLQLIGIEASVPWEENGFEIIGKAHNGSEGVELIQQLRPDIVIADIVMPKLDGLAMIQWVVSAGSRAKFIVLSCMNDIQYYKDALKLGVSEYLQKELVTPELLLRTVKRVADELQKERVVDENEGGAAILNARVLQTEYVTMLLSGRISNDRSIGRKLQEWHVLRMGECFRIGAIGIHFFDRIPDGGLLEYNLINICEEILSREKQGRLLRVGENQLFALLPPLEPDRARQIFDRMRNTAEQCLDCTLTMGISDITNNLESLRELYIGAKRAEQMGFFFGHGKLYFACEQAEGNDACDATPMMSVPLRPLRRFSEAELRIELEELMNRIRSDAPNVDQAKAKLVGFAHRILMLAEQSFPEARLTSLDRQEIIERCNAVKTLDQAYHLLDGLLCAISAQSLHGQSDELVHQVKQYVEEHIHEKINLNEIARFTYSTPSHISRVFKQETGSKLGAYIRLRKIEEAKQLLSQMSVGETAELLGYTSVSHFVAIFSEEEEMTPYKYKKAISDRKE